MLEAHVVCQRRRLEGSVLFHDCAGLRVWLPAKVLKVLKMIMVLRYKMFFWDSIIDTIWGSLGRERVEIWEGVSKGRKDSFRGVKDFEEWPYPFPLFIIVVHQLLEDDHFI